MATFCIQSKERHLGEQGASRWSPAGKTLLTTETLGALRGDARCEK
jgi:hypothetical protein